MNSSCSSVISRRFCLAGNARSMTKSRSLRMVVPPIDDGDEVGDLPLADIRLRSHGDDAERGGHGEPALVLVELAFDGRDIEPAAVGDGRRIGRGAGRELRHRPELGHDRDPRAAHFVAAAGAGSGKKRECQTRPSLQEPTHQIRLWLPSQNGFPAVCLQPQNQTSTEFSALYCMRREPGTLVGAVAEGLRLAAAAGAPPVFARRPRP